jgi:hypothetical protein
MFAVQIKGLVNAVTVTTAQDTLKRNSCDRAFIFIANAAPQLDIVRKTMLTASNKPACNQHQTLSMPLFDDKSLKLSKSLSIFTPQHVRLLRPRGCKQLARWKERSCEKHGIKQIKKITQDRVRARVRVKAAVPVPPIMVRAMYSDA